MDLNLIGAVTLPDASPFVQGLVLLFAFLIGHALADFPLQGPFLAIGKDKGTGLERFSGTPWPPGMWAYCLTMHSLIQAGAVWVISGSVVLGFTEFVLHWFIDCAKSSKLTGFYLDQALHVLCKIGYVIALYLMA